MKRSLHGVGTFPRARVIAVLAALSFIALPSGALAGPNGTDRPLKGECDATFTERPTDPMHPLLEVFDVRLACHFTHLGSTTGTAIQVVDFAGFPSTPPTVSTTIEYVAANGDKLRAAFSGWAIPHPDFTVSFFGGTAYHGGTGRFHDASGGSFDKGSASLISGTGVFDVSGRLSY